MRYRKYDHLIQAAQERYLVVVRRLLTVYEERSTTTSVRTLLEQIQLISRKGLTVIGGDAVK